ncbi:chemotaxis regulatory protein ChePep [Helicobacter pylori]
MKMILFNQNPMITKLLESVSKKLELPMENFNHYQELSTHLKEEPEWILIADDECLEKLDQVDWLELKETISQNKNSVCMYKKGNEAQPFLEGFEMKIQKPFLPTEILKILQKKLGSNASKLEPSQNLDPTQEVLETNWDELENLGDLEALAKEEPNNEEQLLPTLNNQEEKEEVKEEEKEEKEEVKEEIKETPKEEEKPKEETQEEQTKEQEPVKEETQEIKEEKQEKTQDSPSAQELEAMQELVKEIQENSNSQENKEETQEKTETPQETPQDVEIPQEKTQENTETPQEKETQELEIPKEKTQENAETPQEKEAQENAETPQEKEAQENAETPQDVETPQAQEKETQEDHYESIEDIPEPVMAKAMGEELPFLNEAVAKIPNNENDTETPKESDIKTPQETPQESVETPKESDKTSSPLELRLNLQDLLKSLNQESLKSLLENKILSIKITLEDKKPDA